MDILICAGYLPSIMGGIEVYTWEHATHLADKGYKVHLFGTEVNCTKDLKYNNIYIYSIKN